MCSTGTQETGYSHCNIKIYRLINEDLSLLSHITLFLYDISLGGRVG